MLIANFSKDRSCARRAVQRLAVTPDHDAVVAVRVEREVLGADVEVARPGHG